jgi:hypothetical protein
VLACERERHIATGTCVATDIERNQLKVKVSIATVKWLTSQACAFRGHDETPSQRIEAIFLS